MGRKGVEEVEGGPRKYGFCCVGYVAYAVTHIHDFLLFFLHYKRAYQLHDKDGEGQAGSPRLLVSTPVCRDV